MTARERVAQLLDVWPKVYPDAHCELDFKNPLELLIATILSAQCTDKRVNMVTPALFKKYRTAADYAKAPQPELEHAIRSTGFFRNKAKSIRAATSTIDKKFGGKVPRFDGRTARIAGCWPKNRKRCARQCVWKERRDRSGHARGAFVAAARPNETERRGKN